MLGEMLRPPLLFSLSFVVACTTAQKPTIAPDEVAVTTPPRASAAPAMQQQQPEPPPQRVQPRKEQKLPDDQGPPAPPKPAIGAPCTTGTPGCGRNGTIAVVVDRRHSRRWHAPNEPCKVEQTRPAVSTINATFACVEDNHLIVSSVCMVCRMADAGESLEGVVSEMTDEQLLEAQQIAGLPPAPILSTQDAWKKAIARAVAANAAQKK